MKTIADALGVARRNLVVQAATAPRRRRGRPPQPEVELLAEIKQVIVGQPTYGYRRVHALIRSKRGEGGAAVNVKRVYRLMKAYGLLLKRHTGNGIERRHDGRIAVDRPDTRWCSDGFEIGCDNGERVRIAFTLDCCDREAISWVATTGGIDSGDIRDRMIEKRRTPLWLGEPIADPDRVAVRRRLALYRSRDPGAGPRDRSSAVHHAD
jgi:putative transposase